MKSTWCYVSSNVLACGEFQYYEYLVLNFVLNKQLSKQMVQGSRVEGSMLCRPHIALQITFGHSKWQQIRESF